MEAPWQGFAQQELFVGIYYPAGKALNRSFWFPYSFHCLNTGNGEGLWGRVSHLPRELTKYEKLSPQGICEQIASGKVVFQDNFRTAVNFNFAQCEIIIFKAGLELLLVYI